MYLFCTTIPSAHTTTIPWFVPPVEVLESGQQFQAHSPSRLHALGHDLSNGESCYCLYCEAVDSIMIHSAFVCAVPPSVSSRLRRFLDRCLIQLPLSFQLPHDRRTSQEPRIPVMYQSPPTRTGYFSSTLFLRTRHNTSLTGSAGPARAGISQHHLDPPSLPVSAVHNQVLLSFKRFAIVLSSSCPSSRSRSTAGLPYTSPKLRTCVSRDSSLRRPTTSADKTPFFAFAPVHIPGHRQQQHGLDLSSSVVSRDRRCHRPSIVLSFILSMDPSCHRDISALVLGGISPTCLRTSARTFPVR